MKGRVGIVVASFLLASAAHGRESGSDSQLRARELVRRALRHAGAPEGEAGALTLSWRQIEHREGAMPGTPERWPAEVTWTRDPATGEQAWVIERASPRPLKARLLLSPSRALLIRGGPDGPARPFSAVLGAAGSRRAAASRLLEPPTELGPEIAPVLETTPAPELRELARGVALIRDAAPLYNVLLVALATETLMIETPHDPATVRRALALAREWRPDAPVGHAVVTHFHSDHMGGLAGVLQAGIPAVVPAGTADFYAALAALPLPASDSSAAAGPAAPVLDSTTRLFGAEGISVELLDVGPTPHSAEMFVAWVPRAGVLFVSDLLTTFGGRIGPGGEDTRLFAERIRRLGLDVALFVPAHGDPIEAARLWSWLDDSSAG